VHKTYILPNTYKRKDTELRVKEADSWRRRQIRGEGGRSVKKEAGLDSV
jgi:hypothetical protein